LKYFKELGIDGFYAQYPLWPLYGRDCPDDLAGNFGVHGLNYYLAARAGYATGLPADRLVGQYCRHYYGKASGPMTRYYLALDRAGRQTHFSANANELVQIFSPEVVRAGRALLAQARQSSADRRVAARIRRAGYSLHYASEMAAIRGAVVQILRDALPRSRVDEVTRRMKRIRDRERRLTVFIKRRMAGKGLFYWFGILIGRCRSPGIYL